MQTIRKWVLVASILYAFCQWGCAVIPEKASPSAQLYMERCGFCHRLPHPARHDFAMWESMIKLMDKETMPVFSEKEKEAILGYLDSGEAEGKKVYTLRCGKCHTLPERGKLTLEEWKDKIKIVVLAHNEMPVYSPSDKEVILKYLRKHSR